jgi:hypothetical protein
MILLCTCISSFIWQTAVVVFPSARDLKFRSTKRFRETWQQVSPELADMLAGRCIAVPFGCALVSTMSRFTKVTEYFSFQLHLSCH